MDIKIVVARKGIEFIESEINEVKVKLLELERQHLEALGFLQELEEKNALKEMGEMTRPAAQIVMPSTPSMTSGSMAITTKTRTKFSWKKVVIKLFESKESWLTKNEVIDELKIICHEKLEEIGDKDFVKSVRDYLVREAKKGTTIIKRIENEEPKYTLKRFTDLGLLGIPFVLV